MEKYIVQLLKWLANKFGYKIAMIKYANYTTSIQGDAELLRYTDIAGYVFKKEPLKRIVPEVSKPGVVRPLAPEQLQELGIIK